MAKPNLRSKVQFPWDHIIEKRQFPRKDVLVPALLFTIDRAGVQVQHSGIMKTLSLQGAGIALHDYEEECIKENERCTLEFTLPASQILTSTRCRVVWCKKNVFTTMVGVEFTDLSFDDYFAFQNFLN